MIHTLARNCCRLMKVWKDSTKHIMWRWRIPPRGVLTACSPVEICLCFVRTRCLHLQSRRMKMEIASFSETLVNSYQTRWHNIPESSISHNRLCQAFRSPLMWTLFTHKLQTQTSEMFILCSILHCVTLGSFTFSAVLLWSDMSIKDKSCCLFLVLLMTH